MVYFFRKKKEAGMQTDIEIAQAATLAPIREIAAKVGLKEEELEAYGRYKAKVDLSFQPARTQNLADKQLRSHSFPQ